MVEQVIELLKKRNWNDGERGCHASFFSVDEKWGVKLYQCEDTADHCYEAQETGLKFDIAPRLGDRLNVKLGNKSVYGFITEKAKIAAFYACDELGIPHMDDVEINKQGHSKRFYSLMGYSLDRFSWNAELEKHHNTLYDTIHKHLNANAENRQLREFFRNCFNDLHCYNWGVLDNRPVMIDFSFG